MSQEQVVAYAASKKLMLSRDALSFLEGRQDYAGLIDSVASRNVFLAGREDFNGFEQKEHSNSSQVLVQRRTSRPAASEIEPRIKVSEPRDTGSLGEASDFLSYFKSNYSKRREIFLKTRDLSIIDISKTKHLQPRSEASFVGMVFEKYETKNGHVMLTLEDLTGSCKVLVLKDDRELMAVAQDVIEDDVVLVSGSKSNSANSKYQDKTPMLVAKLILLPEIPQHKPPSCSEDVSVAITGDLHLGHKKFAEGAFKKFLSWLKGETGSEKQREAAGKVKYLVLAGDLVDGVGVYPGQEEEQVITDVYQQYEELEKYLQEVPEYVHVVAIPGDHDAVRVEDPMPRIPEKYLPKASKLENVHFLGSPARVELHGFKFLLYHGSSMFNVFSMVPHKAKVDKPETAMVEYLRRRHLSPFYGTTPNSRTLIFPEKEDVLAIDEIPDVLVTGHLHKNGYENYHGTLAVNPGTWQMWTAYQAKQGIVPTPGVVPVLNLKSFTIHEMRFLAGEV
ncbi:MAG TPA: metallophosphoesterase [archaeon]|nr:metallophosphoesterase [archaeon]